MQIHPYLYNNAQRAYQHFKRVIISVLIDIVLILGAYTAVFSVRAVTASLNFIEGLPFILLIVVVMIAVFEMFGIYNRIWERSSGHEITLIFKAVGAATLIIVVADIIIAPRLIPVSVILVANALITSGLIAVRYRSRLLTGTNWRWKAVWDQEFPKTDPKTKVLIIGAGESGQTLALRMKYRFSSHDYEVVGFIDDDPSKQRMYIEGCRVLGTRADIVRVAEAHNVDLIAVAVHNISGADFREMLNHCEKTKALVKVIPNIMALVNATQNTPLLRNVEPEDLIGRKPISRSKDVDLSSVTGKIILVTGAAGSIGSELSRQIMEYEPVKVVLLDNNESGLHDLVTELKTKYPLIDLTPVLADITVQTAIEPIFRKYCPQVIFHAAAYKHVPMIEYYPHEALRVNVGGTICLAKLAGEIGAERFVLISTDKAVNPTSVMGASKRMCELILHALSSDEKCRTLYTSVRFGNVLGSRGSVIPTFSRQIESGGPVTVTHQEMTRYFMSIPEAVNLIIHAACLTKGNDIYMLKMGEKVRIVELAERMIRLRGLRPYRDVQIQFTGIRPGEKMHEELFDSSEKLIDTVHPNIVELQSQENGFNAALFMENLADLLKKTSISETEALNVLLHVIHPSENNLSLVAPT